MAASSGYRSSAPRILESECLPDIIPIFRDDSEDTQRPEVAPLNIAAHNSIHDAACVGLLPAALSTAIGSQVQRPLALVVVGGILLAPSLVLLTLPELIGLFSRRHRHATRPGAALEPAE